MEIFRYHMKVGNPITSSAGNHCQRGPQDWFEDLNLWGFLALDRYDVKSSLVARLEHCSFTTEPKYDQGKAICKLDSGTGCIMILKTGP